MLSLLELPSEPTHEKCCSQGKRTCNFAINTQAKEIFNPNQVKQMLELDFSERADARALSLENKKFLKKMDENIHQEPDGHCQMLPVPSGCPKFTKEQGFALHRLGKLKCRLKDLRYRQDYTEFMNDVTQRGYAERVPKRELSCDSGKVWYIPHQGVYHPKKPDRTRIVFDCSAEYGRQSLNKHLLQGPDLTNSLAGVLCRFRQEPIALTCDLEAMFYQCKVGKEHRDFLRFYWWENGYIESEPVEYRMTVHLFGAASSPGCANYGLKKTADDYEGRMWCRSSQLYQKRLLRGRWVEVSNNSHQGNHTS